MRAIGIDVHGDLCEVALSEDGHLRSAGRIAPRPAELEVFAASLSDDDEVALEATGNALAIARILEPHVARVVVASARELHAVSGAKAKTDRRDARSQWGSSTTQLPRSRARGWRGQEPRLGAEAPDGDLLGRDAQLEALARAHVRPGHRVERGLEGDEASLPTTRRWRSVTT